MRRRQLPGEPPPPSKGELKRQAQARQALADRLVDTPAELLAELDLPDKVRDAIELAQRIGSHGALLRQRQYVGKLLRDVDPAPLLAALESRDALAQADVLQFRRAERWRDRLAGNDAAALDEFRAACPDADPDELARLAAEAAAERATGRPAGAGRRLFRWIRDSLGS